MKCKFVALVLGIAMVITSLAGCGSESTKESDSVSSSTENSKEQQDTEAEVVEGIPVDHFAGTELDIAIVRRDALDPSEDFNEKPIIKLVEEATGIHVNWTVIDGSVASERVSALLASEDLPDAMLGLVSSSVLATSPSLFYDFSKEGLLETYAPDVIKDYQEGGQNCLELITWPDGSIRSLVGNVGCDYKSEGNGIMMINQKWLDAVNKEVPTTADEFYDVLCAFRDNDANGNGDPDDEIPLSFCHNDWAAWFMQFANSWGIAGKGSENKEHYMMLKDGIVEPTMDTQAYRDFLEYFHKLAEEGLLDIEGFSQTVEQYDTKQAENRVGIMLEWEPPVDLADDYVAMRPFKVDGYETVKTGGKNYCYGNLTALVASAECSNVEALLHWWNYMSSTPELKWTARYGEEGVCWYKDENGEFWRYSTPPEELGLDPNIQYTFYQAIGNTASPYLTPADVNTEDGVRKRMMDQVYDLILDEYIPTRLSDPLAVEERTFIETDLFEMVESFMATSVVNGVTDESWATYLDNLKTYQYYDWIDWWQGYVDGEY
ncbi:MAG: extracellular solute-binding protein [Lachnospiraceae bacterium]|nr:extracellular solute-binding protein [Lachnospiraceae bacterium]